MYSINISSVPYDFLKLIVYNLDENSLAQLAKTSKLFNKISIEIANVKEQLWEKSFVFEVTNILSKEIDTSKYYVHGKHVYIYEDSVTKIREVFKDLMFSRSDNKNFSEIRLNRDSVNKEIASTLKNAIIGEKDYLTAISMPMADISYGYLETKKNREAEIIVNAIADKSIDLVHSIYAKLASRYFRKNCLTKGLKLINQIDEEEIRADKLITYMYQLINRNTLKDLENAKKISNLIPENQKSRAIVYDMQLNAALKKLKKLV